MDNDDVMAEEKTQQVENSKNFWIGRKVENLKKFLINS